jgi:creatinine amidohydrolase
MTEVQWIRLTAAEITEQARADAVVVLPVGSIEQHGPHLPTMVDMRLAEEVSLRAARAAVATGTPCLVLPTLWAGIAEHHIPFGGTIALDYTTFAGFIRQVARSI